MLRSGMGSEETKQRTFLKKIISKFISASPLMTAGLSSGDLINNRIDIAFLPVKFFQTILVLLYMLSLSSCMKTEIKEPIEYKGPLRKAENVESFYTEKNQVKVKMVAAELDEFLNG